MRLLLWGLSGAVVAVGLFWKERRTALRPSLAPAQEIEAAFWRAEAGEVLSPQEKNRLQRLLSQVSEDDPAAYASVVAYLLIYGGEALQGAPMVYIQRLQQLKSSPTVLAYLGRLAFHTGQVEKARSYYAQALAADSACGTAYLFLAHSFPDSMCFWLRQGASARYSPAEALYLQKLKGLRACP